MTDETITTTPLIDTDQPPAPGADDQKPNVETPAPAAEEQKAEETPEQQAAKRESRRARARMRDAARVAAAETEARMLREQIARAQQQSSPESGEPKREQFEDYESYLRAVTKYDAQQAAREAADKTLRSDREASRGREVQVQREKLAREWTERETAFKAATKDYEQIVAPYADTDLSELSQQAREFIVEVGPQLLYHLANSDDHDRIAALSPQRQVAELGKLEAGLAKPPTKKVSDAPPPVKPVGQGRSAPAGYADNMSDAEYREWRKGQGARWAQR